MPRTTGIAWAPRTMVLLAAVVIFLLAGIDVGDYRDMVAFGLAVFAAAFII